MRSLLAALILGAAAGPAAATTLVNKDDAIYRYTVKSDKTSATGEIAARSAIINVCPPAAARCVVTIEELGEIEVTGADDVVIQGRRLSKE